MPETIATETVSCCVCGKDAHTAVGSGRDFEYGSCANAWTFVVCAGCGHHYLRTRPGPGALGTIYPPNYGNYSNSEKPSLTFKLKAWLERRALRKLAGRTRSNPAVYDIGCGDGRLLDSVKASFPKTQALAGCEIAPFAAQAATGKGYAVGIGSFESIPVLPESYDLVFLIQVLEHLGDPNAAIQKIARMLRSGGLAVFETPSTECFDFRLFHKRYWGGYHFPRHFNLFKRDNAERLLAKAGLTPVSYRVKLQPVHWVWTAHHWLQEMGAPAWLYRSLNIKNPFWIGLGTVIDAMQVGLFRRSSNMQIIVRKAGALEPVMHLHNATTTGSPAGQAC